MLQILEIQLLNIPEYSALCKHIQFNILYRLQRKRFFATIKRINIQLEFSESKSSFEVLRDDGKICEVHGFINSLDGDITKIIALKTCDMIDNLCSVKGWENQFILDIKNEVESGFLIVDTPFFKRVWDNHKQFSAEVICRYFPEYIQFVFRCFQGKEASFETEIAKLKINPWLLKQRYSKLYFLDNCFIIEDPFEEIKLVFSIPDKVLSTVYIPKKHTLEELVNFDKSLDYLTPDNEMMVYYSEYINK